MTPPSSTAAAGVPLERQPELQLQDALGTPLHRANVDVTVQIAGSEGSLGGRTTASSDADGHVRFSDLQIRGSVGSRTLIFAADGFTPVTSSPITVTAGPPAASASSATVPNGVAGTPTAIAIRATDQFGNPATGAAAGISVAVEGANPTPGLPVTEAGPGAYSASYVPIHSGGDQIVSSGRRRGGPRQSLQQYGGSGPHGSRLTVLPK